MEPIVFYSLSAVTLLSALCVVLLRNTMHCSLFLGLTLAGVAGLFGSLGADFLFAAQIMIYVSGVAVLVMFVVMLAGRASELRLRQVNKQWLGALFVCALLFSGLYKFIGTFSGTLARTEAKPTSHDLARMLLSDFAVPFELISVVLIVALVGAVITTRPEEDA